MSFEVELKFPVDDLTAVRQRMEQLGATFRKSVRQVDTYLSHPVRDFAQTDEAFRIRSVGEHNCMTYKGPLVDSLAKTRKEIEVDLEAGGEAFDRSVELVAKLGFRVVRTVQKQRAYLELTFEDLSVELALDEVTGLGTFVELETLAAESRRESARDSLLRLAGQLDLEGQERRSYLSMLIEVDTTSGE